MHTPTPYTANIADTRELEPGKYVREVLISGPHFTPSEIGTAAVDAAFIRKACNMHGMFVFFAETLALQFPKGIYPGDLARTLLAKANE